MGNCNDTEYIPQNSRSRVDSLQWSGSRWNHSTVVVHVGNMEVLFPNCHDRHTIGCIINWVQQSTGYQIQGLSSPHLIRHGREFARHDRIWDLEVYQPHVTSISRSVICAIHRNVSIEAG